MKVNLKNICLSFFVFLLIQIFGTTQISINCNILYLLNFFILVLSQNSIEDKKEKVLEYLYSIKGKNTLIAIHNREPNSDPTKQTEKVKSITGKYPAMWSGDFLFSSDDVNNRWTMIKECKKQWDEGSIVHLMMHVTPPTQSDIGQWEGGVCSKLTDEEWNDLITEGGLLNKSWKQRLDVYIEYLKYLKDNGVVVLFRPFHEMNQGVFWWAGRKGEKGTAALYRLTRDYIEKEKGINNIIWIWDMQDLSYDWDDYNPGKDYWDIFAVDVYNSDRFTKFKYNLAKGIVQSKLLAIGECDKLPTKEEIYEQNEWSFIMSWAELTFEKNTEEEIKDLYLADNIITRDELPDFK